MKLSVKISHQKLNKTKAPLRSDKIRKIRKICERRVIAVLISLLLIVSAFFAFAAPITAASSFAEALSGCHKVYPQSGADGGFLYGYTADTLYSARLLPEEITVGTKVGGIIRAVSHSGEYAYALFDSSSSERDTRVLKMNSSSGDWESFSLGKLGYADKTSFAVSGNEAFVIKTDSAYAYAQSFRLGGGELYRYSFRSNISRIFQNGDEAYALLFSGELYQIGGGSSRLIARLKADSFPYNAGDGYIFTDKNELVSLESGETEYLECAQPKLSAYSDCGLVTGDGKSVSLGNTEVFGSGRISYLLVCQSQCAAVYPDFSYKTARLDSENNDDPQRGQTPDNEAGGSASREDKEEANANIPYPIYGRVIRGINPPLSVSQFLSELDGEPELYNLDGVRIYTGNVKTGHTLSFGDALYEIAVTGDLNSDGKAKSNDVTALMRHLTGKKTLSRLELLAADYNQDGSVNNTDLLLISRLAD